MRTLRYRNPVYPGYFADPFVWVAGGEYYAIGTGAKEADGTAGHRRDPSVFPMLRSSDLVSWREAGRALVPPDPAMGSTFWAPEVASDGARWYLYYSVGHQDRLHQLRVAISEAPLGPYVDTAGLTHLDHLAFAIDPHPFRDDDGRWYLFFARDFLTTEDERGRLVRPGTALVVRELIEMTRLADDERIVARARCNWQRFSRNRPMYGRLFDWHTLEGPFVVKNRGQYYCFFSGGCWQTDTYGVDYVVADSVLGAYSDEGVERGPRVLRSVPGQVLGPGHCSIVRGPDGQTMYLVYHAWGPDLSARRMCLDSLSFSGEGPSSPGPSWTEQGIGVGSG